MVRKTMPSWLTLCGAPTLLTAKRPPCASAPGAIYHLQPKTALSRFPPVHKTNLERQQRVRFDPFATRSVYDRYLRIPAVHYSVIRMSESLIAVPRSRPERTDSNSGPSRLMPGSAGGDLRIEEDGLGLPLLIKGAILSRHR
jgi:hypothetical protein